MTNITGATNAQPGSTADMRPIRLPFFEGFYQGVWNNYIDYAIARFCEDEETEHEPWLDRAYDGVPRPEHLRLSQDTLLDIVMQVTDWQRVRVDMAQLWCSVFDDVAACALLIPLDQISLLGLEFDELVSPHEYNYTTDRIFARIPARVIQSLFALSAHDGHASLAKLIAARCMSRDGFLPYYSDDIAVWLDKPVTAWDHNELSMLLEACLIRANDAIASDVREATLEALDDENAFDLGDAVDWDGYNRLAAKARRKQARRVRNDARRALTGQ